MLAAVSRERRVDVAHVIGLGETARVEENGVHMFTVGRPLTGVCRAMIAAVSGGMPAQAGRSMGTDTTWAPGLPRTAAHAKRPALDRERGVGISNKSQRSGLNRRPPDYESGALPLSYAGEATAMRSPECPGADSNRDAFRHHPLKMACLPISPPGHTTTGPTGLEPATSRVTVECSNQTELRPPTTRTANRRQRAVS